MAIPKRDAWREGPVPPLLGEMRAPGGTPTTALPFGSPSPVTLADRALSAAQRYCASTASGPLLSQRLMYWSM
eukprot:3697242-Prymnesium_polylepis.1